MQVANEGNEGDVVAAAVVALSGIPLPGARLCPAAVSPAPDNLDEPQITFTVTNSGAEFSDSHTTTTDDGEASATLGCDEFSYVSADIVIPVDPDTFRVVAGFEGSPGFGPSVSDTVDVTCNPSFPE